MKIRIQTALAVFLFFMVVVLSFSHRPHQFAEASGPATEAAISKEYVVIYIDRRLFSWWDSTLTTLVVMITTFWFVVRWVTGPDEKHTINGKDGSHEN